MGGGALKHCFSRAALGDSTDHKAPAIMASLKEILDDLIKEGAKQINIITDSPMSQYRNKSIFWFISKFCEDNGIAINWIYLESGHGKGIADGVGANMKRTILDLMGENPEIPMYTCNDICFKAVCKVLSHQSSFIHTPTRTLMTCIPCFQNFNQ